MEEKIWLNGWLEKDYQDMKQRHFEIIDNYINRPLKNILDIGCGLAFESRNFYKKYNSELYLIDGDFNDNQRFQNRYSSWGDQADIKYYSKLKDLDSFFKADGVKKYKLIDCQKIDIPNEIKFDLICSYLSCGFHYPLESYKELIKKHSNENSCIIFTLRKNKDHKCEIKKIINETDKYITASISL